MRSRFALASSAVGLVLAAGACTSLLGTFTVGDGGSPDASDAASDSPAVVGLSCAETSGARLSITTGGALHAYQTRIGSIGGNRTRIIVPDVVQGDSGGQSVVVHAYTVDSSHNIATSDTATSAGQIYSITRYATGFAILYDAQDDPNQPGKSFLWAAHIEDNSLTWSPPVELVPSPQQAGSGNHGATFVAIDGTHDSYMVAYTYAAGATQSVIVGPLSPSDSSKFMMADSFPTIATDQASYQFMEPAIALQPGNPPLVMMAPNGNQGPPAQGTPVKVVVPGNASFLLTPPSNLNYFPYGFVSAVSPTKANLSMLVANLTTFVGGTYVGQVDFSALTASFNPQTLPETLPSDGGSVQLQDLFIGSGTTHWEVAGSGEQLIMVAAPSDPLTQTTANGINFGWWDGVTGANHAYLTGTNAVAPDVANVATVDATFQTLVGSIAAFQVAYVSDISTPKQNGGQPVAGDLYLSGIACQPK